MLVTMAGNKTQNIDVRDMTRELPRTVARRQSWRVLKTVVGVALIGAGIAFSVVPFFPGFPLILLGLAVLATEFFWARRAQAKLRARLGAARPDAGEGRRREATDQARLGLPEAAPGGRPGPSSGTRASRPVLPPDAH